MQRFKRLTNMASAKTISQFPIKYASYIQYSLQLQLDGNILVVFARILLS